jgi:hypothetical protein
MQLPESRPNDAVGGAQAVETSNARGGDADGRGCHGRGGNIGSSRCSSPFMEHALRAALPSFEEAKR